MTLKLIKLKPNDKDSKPAPYLLANNLYLLAVETSETRFHYRAYRPNLPFDGHGIHDSDIEQVFDLDYAKLNHPEIFI